MENIIGAICGVICGVCMAVVLGTATYYIVNTINEKYDDADEVTEDDSI